MLKSNALSCSTLNCMCVHWTGISQCCSREQRLVRWKGRFQRDASVQSSAHWSVSPSEYVKLRDQCKPPEHIIKYKPNPGESLRQASGLCYSYLYHYAMVKTTHTVHAAHMDLCNNWSRLYHNEYDYLRVLLLLLLLNSVEFHRRKQLHPTPHLT